MAAWQAPYNDATFQLALPQGICNFKDLDREQAPVCPCRRFYLDRTRLDPSSSSVASTWCFCGHHACFHDHNSPLNRSQSSQAAQLSRGSASQIDERSSISELASQRHISQEQEVRATYTSIANVGLGLGNQISQPGIWDALNAYVRRQAEHGSDPAAALPSTAVPSTAHSAPTSAANGAPQNVVRHFNHSGRFCEGLENAPLKQQDDTDIATEIASVTEMNTPSIHGTPVLLKHSPDAGLHRTQTTQAKNALSPPAKPTVTTKNSSQRSDRPQTTLPQARVQQRQQVASAEEDPNPSIHELRNIIKTCTQRLDLLESLSYTHVPLDEVEDKFEHVDNRLLSLEDFRSEVESRFVDDEEDGAKRKRRLLPAETTTSFCSDVSISQTSERSSSSANSATAAVYAEYNGRIEAMSQRIDVLEKSIPALSQPWEIEVVFLPWGRHLPGIWAPSSTLMDGDLKQKDVREEWNGNNSTTHDIFGDRVAASAGWSTDSIQAWAESAQDWLSPKACGPNGMVYRRLWSRGLVKTIKLESSDARHVMQRLKTSFSHVLPKGSVEASYRNAKVEFDALRESLVPLRKIRKVTRLRFLAPSEMISSALWTAQFLEANVLMKAKGHLRRLYVTSPEAYLQQAGDGWTWSAIRTLPNRAKASPDAGPGFEGQNEDFESAWAHHSSLDANKYVSESFISNASRQSAWSTKSQASRGVRQADQRQPEEIGTLSALVSPVSESRTFKAYRRRTVSIPPEEAGSSAATPKGKRRVASFETAALEAKKRKTGMSSQARKPGPGHTPRLSREPPSPFASDYPLENRSDGTSGRRVVLTPLAYATPHSHTNNAMAALYTITRDGHSEADTEIIGQEHSQAMTTNEWRGVGDEQYFPSSQDGDNTGQEGAVIIRGSDGDESELDE